MAPFRTYLFFGLNAVRAISIISLILVFASSILVMVTDIEAVNNFESANQTSNSTTNLVNCDYIEGSTVPNQIGGVFWAVINRLFIIFQVIVLSLSEIGWPAAFFDRFFPVIGTSFGVGALGIFQCLIGASVLSQHVDDFTLVAAFFLFSIGCLNMLLGLIFRESIKTKRSITAWRNESKEILPTVSLDRSPSSFSSSSFGSSTYVEKANNGADEHGVRNGGKAGYGFGTRGEKAAGLKGFLISKPLETLPRYAPRPTSAPITLSESSRSSSPAPQFQSSGTAI